MMYGLIKMDIPNVSFGSFNIKYLASTIIWISFALSFFKTTFGDPTTTAANIIASKLNMGISGKTNKTWIEWIMDSMGSGIIMVFKTIGFIIYWILRATVTSLIIPVSIFIFVVYFFWISIFSLFDYTDKNHSYNDKLEMIDRFIYTKLFVKSETSPMWFFRSVCFLAIFLLTEIVIFYTLYKNMKSFNNMPAPKKGGPIAANAAQSIKTFMNILTSILIVILVIWSIFKYYTNKIMLNEMYSPDTGDHIFDNSCDYTITSDVANLSPVDIYYFNQNKDSIKARITNSDRLTEIFSKYYIAKTNDKVHRPMMQKILNKMSGIGKYISDTVNPTQSYSSIKPDNTGFLSDPAGLLNKLRETASNGWEKEMETAKNTNFSEFFGNVDPTKLNLADGIKKMFAMVK